MAKKLVTGFSIIGALATVILLLVIFGVLTRVIFPVSQRNPEPTAILKVVNAATPTHLLLPGMTPVPSQTPTLDPVKYAGIGVEKFVQITGTGGDGLRLRSGPGTENPPLFLGLDAEVFQVKDGPRESDGIVWWFLVSPTDENRKGWASANYLVIVPSN